MRRLVFSSVALLALSALTATPRAFGEDAPNPPDKPDDGGHTPKVDRAKTKGYIGVAWGLAQRLTADDRKETGITVERGMVITHLLLDGPAMKAGVLVGDVPVSLNGTPLPDAKDLTTDEKAFDKFIEEKYKPIGDKINPGEKAVLGVLRAGKPMTFEIVTIDLTARDALEELDRQEQAAVKVPKAADSKGPPKAAALDFEGKLAEGESRPAEFLQVTGFWEVQEDETKAGNHVLFESSDLGDAFCLGVLTGDGHVYADGTASLRFAFQKGERSASAGIAVRVQNRTNYYALRVDGVAQDVAICKVVKDAVTVLAKAAIKSPKLLSWHTLDVSWRGKTLEAVYDGATKVTFDDGTFTSGWTGLVTYGDASSLFDDWKVTPAAAAGGAVK